MADIQTLALCVPAFNAAEFLPRLLVSATTQTIPFDEIWIYDDCSSDNTAEIAAEFGVNVIKGDFNRGCAHGHNAAVERSSCDWVHFHDADDELYPTFVESAHQWMRAGSPDAILFAYDWVDELSGAKLSTRYYDDEALRRDPIEYSLREQIQSICGIYRRQKFLEAGGYDLDPEVLYNEDVAMHTRLARSGFSFAADPSVTVINYKRGNSMSAANQVRCIQAHVAVLRKSCDALNGRYSEVIAMKLWLAASTAATYLDWKTADAAVGLAVKLQGRVPARESNLFRLLCVVHPHFALRIREYLIRAFKPQYRRDAANLVHS